MESVHGVRLETEVARRVYRAVRDGRRPMGKAISGGGARKRRAFIVVAAVAFAFGGLAITGEVSASADTNSANCPWPEWSYTVAGHTWFPVVPGDMYPKEAEGYAGHAKVASEDHPASHDSQDFTFNLGLFDGYRSLLSTEPPYYGVVDDVGPGAMHMEWESGEFNMFAWPARGDRVWTAGMWIWDCGHKHKTELHPLVGIATMRDVPLDSGRAIVPGSRTDIWFNTYGGDATDRFLSQDGMNLGLPWGFDSQLQPFGPFGAIRVWQNYDFFVPLPPRPPGASPVIRISPGPVCPPIRFDYGPGFQGVITSQACAPGTAVFPATAPPPSVQVTEWVYDYCFLPAPGCPALYVELPLDGYAGVQTPVVLCTFSGCSLTSELMTLPVYSFSIEAMWDYIPPVPARPLIIDFQEININDDLAGVDEPFDGPDGEYRLWVNVNDRWFNMQHYGLPEDVSDGRGLGNDAPTPNDYDLDLSLLVHVFPGDSVHIRASGFEDDPLFDDNMGVAEQTYGGPGFSRARILGLPDPHFLSGGDYFRPTPYHTDNSWPAFPQLLSDGTWGIAMERQYGRTHELFARGGYEDEGDEGFDTNCRVNDGVGHIWPFEPDLPWVAGSCFSLVYAIDDLTQPVFTVQQESVIRGETVVNVEGRDGWLTGRCVLDPPPGEPVCDSQAVGLTVLAQDPWAEAGVEGFIPMDVRRDFVHLADFPLEELDESDAIAGGDIIPGDGVDEIVIADGEDIRIHDQHGNLLGSFMVEEAPGGRSALGDVDGDGVDEVVMLDGHVVKVFETDGGLASAFRVVPGSEPRLAVGNLVQDASGSIDEILVADGSTFRIIDRNGVELDRLDPQDIAPIDSLAIGNVSRAGLDEIVVLQRDGGIHVLDNTGGTVAFLDYQVGTEESLFLTVGHAAFNDAEPIEEIVVAGVQMPFGFAHAVVLREEWVYDLGGLRHLEFRSVDSFDLSWPLTEGDAIAVKGPGTILVGDGETGGIGVFYLGGIFEPQESPDFVFPVSGFGAGDALLIMDLQYAVVCDGENIRTYQIPDSYSGSNAAILVGSFLEDSPLGRGFVVGDVLSGNGADETVIADGRLGLVRTFDSGGTILGSFFAGGMTPSGHLALGDVDGLGPDEILVVDGQSVRAFSHTGRLVSSFSLPWPVLNEGFLAAGGDLDGVGPDEIVVVQPMTEEDAFGTSTLFDISTFYQTGQPLSSFEVSEIDALAVGNVDGGGPDRIILAMGPNVYFFDPSGGLLLADRLGLGADTPDSLALGDVNGAGVNELFLGRAETSDTPGRITVHHREGDLTKNGALVEYAFLDGAYRDLGGDLDCSPTDSVLCNYFADPPRIGWILEIRECGIHTFELNARNTFGRSAIFGLTLKVDICSPRTGLIFVVDTAGAPLADGGYTLFGPAIFTFEGQDDTSGLSGFECSLDGSSFSACTSPFSGGSVPGVHTFQVHAVDVAGNRDPSPEVFTWRTVTPSEASQILADIITDMDLPPNTERPLLGLLAAVPALLADENPSNDAAACNLLAVFVDRMDAYEAKGALTGNQAAMLRDLAEDIRTKLDCT